MLHHFAGPIFVEWYWIPFGYFILTWPFALIAFILAFAVAATNASLSSNKKEKLADKTIRNILLVCLGLWVLGLGIFYVLQSI